MAEVKNVGRSPASLPGGRLLPVGQTAKNVDPDHPEVAAAIEDGSLALLGRPKGKPKPTTPTDDATTPED